MEKLYSYIKPSYWDGHIHLFNHEGILQSKIPTTFTHLVGFMDVVFSELDNYKTTSQVVGYYKNFIEENKIKQDVTLLATGTTAKQALDVYKKFPNIIKGFGEFKCYDEYTNSKTGEVEKLPFGNLDWIRPVFEFDLPLRLPIYIHWDLKTDKKFDGLDNLLSDFSTIPVVLCHCGMCKKGDNEKVWERVISLMEKHTNLWVDISYTAFNFFLENPMRITMLPNRVFLGSDINQSLRKLQGKIGVENEYSKFKQLTPYIPYSTNNIKSLFRL